MKIMKKQEKYNVDYKGIFFMGLTFTGLGLLFSTINKVLIGITVLGIIYLIIGFKNKNKWNKVKRWNELSKKEKNFKIFALFFGIIALIIGLSVFLMF